MAQPDPFRPPGYVKQTFGTSGSLNEMLRKVLKFLTIGSAVTIIGLPFAAIFGLMWLLINVSQKRLHDQTATWFKNLAESRGASVADLGVYMGGHPLLPLVGQCALYLAEGELRVELEGGQQCAIPMGSIESIDSGVETIHAEGLFGLPTEFAWSNMYFVITFKDDKGLTNKVRVAGTLGASGHEWAGFISSARYAAA